MHCRRLALDLGRRDRDRSDDGFLPVGVNGARSEQVTSVSLDEPRVVSPCHKLGMGENFVVKTEVGPNAGNYTLGKGAPHPAARQRARTPPAARTKYNRA